MEHALALAREGVGLASPNPTVGCVIVNNGQIIGEGFHQYDWRDHAEIVALKSAKERGRGSTLYVTLEPCRDPERKEQEASANVTATNGSRPRSPASKFTACVMRRMPCLPESARFSPTTRYSRIVAACSAAGGSCVSCSIRNSACRPNLA